MKPAAVPAGDDQATAIASTACARCYQRRHGPDASERARCDLSYAAAGGGQGGGAPSAVSGRAPAATTQTPAATPAPAATTGPAAATAKEAWGVQLGSFSSAVNAERLARTLRGKGYRAFVSPIGTGTHLLHRVRVGPEPTRDAAEGLLARLKRDGQSAAVVSFP